MFNRQNDYQHWVVCPCGWRGFLADMNHDYQGYGRPECYDIEPIDHCPICGGDDIQCTIYDIVQRRELSLSFPVPCNI